MIYYHQTPIREPEMTNLLTDVHEGVSPIYLLAIELNILVEDKTIWYLAVKIVGRISSPHRSISVINRHIYNLTSINGVVISSQLR
jgi:hypothetical protein